MISPGDAAIIVQQQQLNPVYRNATTNFPQPNVSSHIIRLQAAWNINPLPVEIPANSILMTDTTIAVGSHLPVGFPLTPSSFLQAATVINQTSTQTTPGTIAAGSIIQQGSSVSPPPTITSTITSTSPQVLPVGTDLTNVFIPGPANLPFSVTLGVGSALPSTVTFSPALTLSVAVTLPDGTVVPAGTAVTTLPAGTLVNADSFILPAGTAYAGTSFGGVGVTGSAGTVPAGTQFLPGYGAGSDPYVFPGPYVVGTAISFNSATFLAGTEFGVGSSIDFISYALDPFVTTAAFTLSAPTPPLLSSVMLAPGSTVAMWSVLWKGVVLPFGNIKPVKLFSADSQCPEVPVPCAPIQCREKKSRVVSAFHPNTALCGPEEVNLYDEAPIALVGVEVDPTTIPAPLFDNGGRPYVVPILGCCDTGNHDDVTSDDVDTNAGSTSE